MTAPYWPRLLKLADAAAYLSLPVAEFQRAVAKGLLPMPRVVEKSERWDRKEIDRHLDGEDWERNLPFYKGRAA